MKILLDGYADRNLGDDLMIGLAANGLKEYDVITDKKQRADVFLKVIGSGFLIGENRGIPYRLLDMHNESRYAKEKIVMNCNISPFINKLAEKILLLDIKSCSLITVRDEFSYNYIRKNAPRVECVKYPDMVMSLPETMIPETECRGTLGIAVHNSINIREAAKLADGYIAKTGNGVSLLCFDSGRENDAAAAERIRSEMNHDAEIVIYDDIRAMLGEMKRCGVILCARLHSAILSARMGIPFLPLSYSDKAAGALREIGYTDKICPAAEIEADIMLDALLTRKPFKLGKNVIQDAGGHIEYFKQYLGRRR